MLPLNSIRFALAAALVGASAASALAATNNSDDSNSIKQVVIYSAAPDYVSGTMLVSGANFGTSASFVGTVSLYQPYNPRGIKPLTVKSFSSALQELVVQLPTGITALPGSYLLIVNTAKNSEKGDSTVSTDVFTVTLGAAGPKGDKGLIGDQGIQGIQGLTGAKGDQGIQGLKGDKGDQGLQGIQGSKGDQGLQGLKGDKGDQGAQGIQGLKGDKGDQGIQGFQGLQGQKGDKGEQGDQGAQGIQGTQGPTGQQGIQGSSGVTGLANLPIFQTERAASEGGVAVGSYWVQSNGQVWRMMEHTQEH